jgi:hypothetical protein
VEQRVQDLLIACTDCRDRRSDAESSVKIDIVHASGDSENWERERERMPFFERLNFLLLSDAKQHGQTDLFPVHCS